MPAGPGRGEQSHRKDWGLRAPTSPRQAVRYSRFVGVMRVVLPALAVGLLALLALWPSIDNQTAELMPPLNEADVAGERPRMVNPRYYGTDANNLPFSLRAAQATHLTDEGDLIVLDSPSGEMTLGDGTRVALEARSGYFDRANQTVTLKGGVDLRDSRGYEVRTSEASIDLRGGVASGDKPVYGEGPFGDVQGDGFEWRKENGMLRLRGPARLTVTPDRVQEP